MRLRIPTALSLTAMLLSPAPTHAAMAFGVEFTALGSATVTSEPVGSDGRRRIRSSGIGSSGQDGVSITLPLRGILLQASSEPGSPVVAGELSIRRFPSDATPVIRGSWTSTGSGERTYGITVQTPVMHCSVYDGDLRVFSASMPSSTPITVSGLVAAADTSRTLGYRARAGSSGSAKREISIDVPIGQVVTVSVGTASVAGDRIVFDVEQDGPPEFAGEARLFLASEVGSPPIDVLVHQLAIDLGVTPTDPRGFREGMELIVVRGVEQVATAVVEAVEGDARYRTLDGETAELQFVAPSSGDPASGLHRWSWTYAETPADATARVQSIVANMQVDDGSGLPPVDGTFTVDWADDGSGSGGCLLSAGSSLASDDVTVQVYALGRPVGQPAAAGLGAHVQCSTPPIRVTGVNDPDYMDESLDFVAGTMFLVDGVTQFGDKMKIVAKGSGRRRISDVRIVHPPGTPPGTWKLSSVQCAPSSMSTDEGGRSSAARGPRQSTSLDGTYSGGGGPPSRRLNVKNLGSSGEDGVEVILEGSTGVSFDFLDDPTQVPPAVLSLRTRACLDGSCADDPALEVGSTGVGFTVTGRFTDMTTQDVVLEIGGQMLPIGSADLDGDGVLELPFASPVPARAASVRYLAVAPATECVTLVFTAPVAISCDDGVHVISELSLWRNPGGGSGGGGGGGAGGMAMPQSVSLTGLPPGTPVLGRQGVCDFSILPPGSHVSGSAAYRSDLTTLRAGLVTRSTWGRIEGPVATPMNAGQDEFTLVRKGHWASDASAGAGAGKPGSDANRGFVFESRPLAAPIPWSTTSRLSMMCRGDLATGAADVALHGVEWDHHEDGVTVVDYLPGAAGAGTPEVRAYAGPLQVAVASASSATLSLAPRAIFVGGDLDGDGAPEVDVRALPPGTTVTIGGSTVACDRIVFEPVGGGEVTDVRSTFVSLNGLPPGIPVEGVRLSAVSTGGSTVAVTPRLPAGRTLELRGMAPNPARGSSTLRLALGEAARVRVDVLDVSGRIVATLHDGPLAAGEHALAWSGRTANGQRVAPGLYLARVSSEGLASQTARLVRVE